MSLDHAILGFLNYCPLSGYDLKKVFDISIRHFWAADQSQIYRTLSRLTEKEWTSVDIVEQENRPDRKVYSITPAGREELLRWLNSPMPMESPHSAPLVKVFFAGLQDDENILEYFRAGRQMVQNVLQVYASIPDDLYNRVAKEVPGIQSISPRDRFYWLLTLESGIESMRSTLRWMDSVIERLENKDYTNRLNVE
jgi:DNA-binding PadR family transcriptional regulator